MNTLPLARKGEARPAGAEDFAAPGRMIFASLRASLGQGERGPGRRGDRHRIAANLPAELHKRLRVLAAHRDLTPAQILETALDEYLVCEASPLACPCLRPPDPRPEDSDER